MKFSFEVPIAYMRKFDKVNDYHFMLAHMLLKDKDYAKFFRRSRKTKILDNGCAELGRSIDPDTLCKLVADYRVDVVVLPDVWMNGSDTLNQSLEMLDKMLEYSENLRFMFVVQGNSYSEFKRCASKFDEYCTYRVIWSRIVLGLPYLTCAKIMSPLSPHHRDDDVTNARIYLVQNIPELQRYDIHLLGAGFNVSQEISFMRHLENVKTIDTSTPFILAQQGTKLDTRGLFDRNIHKSGTLDFYAPFDKKVLQLALHNARILKRFATLT